MNEFAQRAATWDEMRARMLKLADSHLNSAASEKHGHGDCESCQLALDVRTLVSVVEQAPVRDPAPPDEPEHPEAFCQQCRRRNVVWFAPSDIWNATMGGGQGILCPVCFIEAAERAGLFGPWIVAPGHSVQKRSGGERVRGVRDPSPPEPEGTMRCPICKLDEPHGHDARDIQRYATAQIARWGYAATVYFNSAKCGPPWDDAEDTAYELVRMLDEKQDSWVSSMGWEDDDIAHIRAGILRLRDFGVRGAGVVPPESEAPTYAPWTCPCGFRNEVRPVAWETFIRCASCGEKRPEIEWGVVPPETT